ncbi:hypothetical protein D021_1555A, partial [Vibrio parahaemolyticus 10296]
MSIALLVQAPPLCTV